MDIFCSCTMFFVIRALIYHGHIILLRGTVVVFKYSKRSLCRWNSQNSGLVLLANVILLYCNYVLLSVAADGKQGWKCIENLKEIGKFFQTFSISKNKSWFAHPFKKFI